MKGLKFTLPSEIVGALSRRHNGREMPKEERMQYVARMTMLYFDYQKAVKKYEYCIGEWWDKMEVEKHYGRPRFYYAHKKLKTLELKKKQLHKDMFYTLLHADGNYEEFGHDALGAEEIYESFSAKYIKV